MHTVLLVAVAARTAARRGTGVPVVRHAALVTFQELLYRAALIPVPLRPQLLCLELSSAPRRSVVPQTRAGFAETLHNELVPMVVEKLNTQVAMATTRVAEVITSFNISGQVNANVERAYGALRQATNVYTDAVRIQGQVGCRTLCAISQNTNQGWVTKRKAKSAR